MKVTISSSVFSDVGTRDVDLMALFGMAYRERCNLITDPPFLPSLGPDGHAVEKWLEGLPYKLSMECSSALDRGAKAEVGHPSARALSITTNSDPDWNSKVPTLPLAAAVEFLNKPFRILVENRRHDRGFLLSTAVPEDRVALENAERVGSATFDHGGGLGEMLTLVESVATNRQEAFRMWVLYDSDQLQPGQPSPDSERVRNACAGVVPGHQLQRRAIENYLPVQVLSAGLRRRHVVHTARAYHSLSGDQRHHYNLKSGFKGDERRRDGLTAGNLYADIKPMVKRHLDNGFGATVAGLFLSPHLRCEAWYLRDGQTVETGPMIRKLLALL